MLQVFLLLARAAHGITQTDTVELESLKRDLFCDVSQNLTWLRPASGNVASVFCAERRFVSYGHDRLVLPEEQLAAMGWQLPRQPQSRRVTSEPHPSSIRVASESHTYEPHPSHIRATSESHPSEI